MVGLSDDGWKAVHQVFSIDYMGAAEYEFGTIPKCLKELAADKDKLIATSITVAAKDIEPNFNRKIQDRTKAGKVRKKQPVHPPVADRVVYVLCRKDHLAGAEESIRGLAGNKIRTKMGSHVADALDPIGERHNATAGWLELDNGFFFFVDKLMWRRTTQLFTGVDPTSEQAEQSPPNGVDSPRA